MVSTDSPRPARGKAARMLRDAEGRFDIKALDRAGLERWVVDELGEKPSCGLRVFKWLWQRGARSFDEMTDVTKATRARLAERAFISFLEPEMVLPSTDGTVKYLWRLEDGHRIESVLIPDDDRLTLCVSSQVGCAMACTFCLTGDLGLKRHLKPSEIANQALQVGRQADRRITNIVMMGMGEPLHNLDSVCTALSVALDDHGLNFSHRRVTVSTVGLVPQMRELAERLPVNLAVSLNASHEAERLRIMPITRRYGIDELLQACREIPLPPGKRITFEYVMFRDDNDSLEDAARLEALLEGIPAKINLIPYNENPDRDLRRPPDERVKAFQHYLVSRGKSCSIRATRGQDISAACGQLGKARQQAEEQGWLDRAREIAGLA